MNVNDTITSELYPLNSETYVEPTIMNYMYYMAFPYAIVLLCFVGIACNVFCIVIFSRDQSTNHTTVFLLQMLAVADMIYLFLCIFTHIAENVFLRGGDYIIVCISAVCDIAFAATMWIVVVVIFDRFLIICRPQLAVKYSTTRRVGKAVCAVWIVSVLVRIPQFLEASQLFNRVAYTLGYRICFHLLVCNVMPLSLITLFAYFLIKAVRDGDPAVVDDKREMTITLNNVVIVFVALQVTSTILQTYIGLDSNFELSNWKTEHNGARMMDGVILVAVSSSKILFYPKRAATPVSAVV